MSNNSYPVLTRPLAMVTGAANGLGLESARALVQDGYDLVLADRDASAGARAQAQLHALCPQAKVDVLSVDLAEPDSIAQSADVMLQRGQPLDLLVNNAGLFPPFERRANSQDCELGLAVGFYGHFALTARLLPLLLKAEQPRVVTVSSIAHSAGRIDLSDPLLQRDYDANRAYSSCKLAGLLFARELDRQSRAHGESLRSIAAHPGISRTRIGQYADNPARSLRQRAIGWAMRFAMRFLGQEADAGAQPIVHAATATTLPPQAFIGPAGFGQFRGAPRLVQPNAAVLERHSSTAVWRMAEDLTGLHFDWPKQNKASTSPVAGQAA